MGASGPPKPPTIVRLLMIGLLLHSGFGYYFTYDAPGALAPYLKSELGLVSTQVGLLYTVVSVGIMTGVLFSGVLLDKFGVWKVLLFGQIVLTLGTFVDAVTASFSGLVVGQIIYGIGSAPIYTVLVSAIGIWFSPDTIMNEDPILKEQQVKRVKLILTITMGCLTLWLRVATFSVYNILPFIAERYGARAGLWFSTFFSCISLCTAILFAILQRREDLAIAAWEAQQQSVEEAVSESNTPVALEDIPETPQPLDIESPITNNNINNNRTQAIYQQLKMFFSMLPWTYWCLFALTLTTLAPSWVFSSFGTTFLTQYWGYDGRHAGRIISVMSITNSICSPLFAYVIGYTRRRSLYVMAATSLLTVMYFLYFTQRVSPWIIYALVGMCQSVVDAIAFPAIPLVVPKVILGKSNAIVVLALNMGLVILPLILGGLNDTLGATSTLLFVMLGAAGMVVSLVLRILAPQL